MSIKICPQMMSTFDVQNENDEKKEYIHAKQCRICLQQSFPLLIPCKCDGTVKYIHQKCLKQWAKEIVKKKLKQQQEEGVYETVTEIECQLCKQNIQLKIEWNDVRLTFNQAKQRIKSFFWLIFILICLIGLISLTSITFVIVVLIMFFTKNPSIDYDNLQNEPLLAWGTLSVAFVVGVIFLIKSLNDLYNIFVKRQFQIKKVISKQIINYQKFTQKEQNKNSVTYLRSIDDLQMNLKTRNSQNMMPLFKTDQISTRMELKQPQSELKFFSLHKQPSKLKRQKLSPLPKFIQSQ